ncbi:MAG: ATP-dependent 6-phosphofructokinase [Pirellulales bacterium]|nr:ATP-dependent 6-phosphofructokinase [Pirellulales bacterium]
MHQQEDFDIRSLGTCLYRSPLHGGHFVSDASRIRYHVEFELGSPGDAELSLEKAGPRDRIFFDPSETTAAIVTCGGLCPGLNNVIRSAFFCLHYNYGVPTVLGIRNGYAGMTPDSGLEPIELTAQRVEDIDKLGGTILGSSRGPQEPAKMVDFLASAGVNVMFCLGGDGTQRGANAICEEIAKRDLPIAVVGIPKTIDNDIRFVWHSFGFSTAVERAGEVIKGAHVEARGAPNGVGLVKLMGRDAGFIAAVATLTSQEVNYTLIPEVAFPLEGANGLLPVLENRIRKRGHAVIVVAEGAGQHLFETNGGECDASGNTRYEDIGIFLKNRIKSFFADRKLSVALKYIDPSYYIRSVPANSRDRILSDMMGRHAVHAAMAGKTGVLIGHVHNQYVHVPIETAVRHKRQLDIEGDTWSSVVRLTRQPRWSGI